MRVIKRAVINLSQHKAKALLLFSIVLVAMTLIVASSAISQAAAEAAKQAKQSIAPEVTIEYNSQKIVSEGPKDVPSVINQNLIDEVKKSPYYKDVIASLQGFVNTDYKTEKSSYGSNVMMDTSSSAPGQAANELTNEVKSIAKNDLGKFAGATNKLVEGVYPFESTLISPILISKKFAADNNLKVGDEMTLNAGEKLDSPLKYTVVGIFETYEKNDASSMMMSFSLENNRFYTTLEGTQAIVAKSAADGSAIDFGSLRVVLDNPDNIEAFVRDIKQSVKDSDYLAFSSSLNKYENITASIRKVEGVAGVIIIIAAAAAFAILGLMIVLQLRDRKYEIGVLLSLGENKFAVASQIMIEVLVVATLAGGTALATSNLVANDLSTSLLSSQLQQTKKDQSSKTPDVSHGTIIMRDGVTQNQDGGTDEKQIDTIKVNVYDQKNLVQSYGLGGSVIILATLLPTLWIMRSNPRKIMLREE